MAITKLKMLLLERGISQAELTKRVAEKCHTPIGKDRISKIVNGKVNNCPLYTYLKICMALDVTPNDIIDKEHFLETETK